MTILYCHVLQLKPDGGANSSSMTVCIAEMVLSFTEKDICVHCVSFVHLDKLPNTACTSEQFHVCKQ
jgi:hypothetical protein